VEVYIGGDGTECVGKMLTGAEWGATGKSGQRKIMDPMILPIQKNGKSPVFRSPRKRKGTYSGNGSPKVLRRLFRDGSLEMASRGGGRPIEKGASFRFFAVVSLEKKSKKEKVIRFLRGGECCSESFDHGCKSE